MEEKFIHLVFFWLKNPENKTDRTKFEDAINKLVETSKYAKNNHIGTPAATNRPVVDSSYTYCLKVTFNNIEEHDKYQIEPAHKLFIAEASKLWERVLIYDSEM
ncbi:Dabb family protein [Lutibacter oricola]|nr:Dabb family protein [Lutibacter oricola]